MPLSTFIAYVVFLLTELLLNRLLRSNRTDLPNADKNSLWFIWVGIGAAISGAVYLADHVHLPLLTYVAAQHLGVFLIYLGIALRLAAVYTLGRFFTVDVTIRQGHQLKRDGFYRYLRHPSYAASLLSFVGLGITLNNWLALPVLVGTVLILFINRIRVEERVLVQHFGAEYLDYKRTTPALLPFVY